MKPTPPPSPSRPEAEPTAREMNRVAAEAAYLVALLAEGVRVVPLPPDTTLTVGRAEGCDLRIEHIALSRRHFTLRAGRPYLVTDLGSANGTRINGASLRPNEPTPLELGHLIEAGGAFFTLRDRDPRGEFAVTPAKDSRVARESPPVVVVKDAAMARLHQLVDVVARSTMPVLVCGETGTGKEIVSTAIHARSPRADRPFVRINCAALPESLLESELFGFERGAFTGATQSKAGLVESADGGSFFLDEIGEMPLTTQAKLLRVLESGEIMRLGALRSRTVDVRFIAATNRQLPSLVAQGKFRRDLYYRLNGITIPIPPLRERLAEIPALARAFLDAAARRAGRPAPALSEDALAMLERHTWPGNVRELKNVMDRAVTISLGDVVRSEHILIDPALPDSSRGAAVPPSPPAVAPPAPATAAPSGPPPAKTPSRGLLLRRDPDEERRLIESALEEAGGNQARAAESLGISRRTLINRLDEFGMKRPRKS